MKDGEEDKDEGWEEEGEDDDEDGGLDHHPLRHHIEHNQSSSHFYFDVGENGMEEKQRKGEGKEDKDVHKEDEKKIKNSR